MLGSKKYLQTRELADLREPLAGWHDPTIGIGHDGAIYATAKRATDYRVVRWHGGETRATTFAAEALNVAFVQPLGDGVLVAGARCRWRPDGADRNAIVVDWSGKVRTRLTLGDGIHYLRTTADDRIWAGYFDEGVFGNYGWGGADGPAPIGAPGLVAFTPDGSVARTFDNEAAGTDDICDVYAMNARGVDDVWVYFYTDFAIAHVAANKTRSWKTRVEGARALAVREHEVALVGGYDNRALIRVVALGKSVAKIARRFTLPDELANAEVHGVGDQLYFVVDRRVLVADAW